MNMLTQIALLAGLIAAISLLWLAGRAFGRHPGWGLAVLFLSPLAAMLFGIRYWREEKGPFLVHVATLAIAASLGLYEFSARGGGEILRNLLGHQPSATLQTSGRAGGMAFVPTSLNVGEKPVVRSHEGITAGARPAQTRPARQEKDQDRSAASSSAGTQTAPEPGAPKVLSAKPIEPKKHYRASYVPIAPSRAGDYVGMTVKVKRLNRAEQDCVLRRVTPTTLVFEQRTRGGTFSFHYRPGDIERLRVFLKQSY